jgi:hypothetical protein
MNEHELYWKDLIESGRVKVDFEFGIIYSCLSGKWRKIGSSHTCGYLSVGAGPSRAIRHIVLAHRVIWIAAHGDIPDGYEINHKNGIKNDNRLCNIECVTRSENTKHAHNVLGKVFGLYTVIGHQRGEDYGGAKLTWVQVAQIRELYKSGHTQEALGKMFGVCSGNISHIVTNKTWIIGGAQYSVALRLGDEK